VQDIHLNGESYAYHEEYFSTHPSRYMLSTRRHTPRTVDSALKHEGDDKPKNPELENTQAFDYYGIPAITVPVRLHG